MPPERLVIYLDENHCNNKHILAVLNSAEIAVERHLDHFPRGTPDEEWLPTVGNNGWLLLTTDKRIRHRANEKEAVIRHRVRMFYFSKNDISGNYTQWRGLSEKTGITPAPSTPPLAAFDSCFCRDSHESGDLNHLKSSAVALHSIQQQAIQHGWAIRPRCARCIRDPLT